MNHQIMRTCNYQYFIPFQMGDPAGILFFGNVFSLAHQAYENFVVSHLKVAWNEWFQHSDWIIPIKSTEANFIAPIFVGQFCAVEIQVEFVKESSFVLHYYFKQNAHCCTVKTVHVFCDKQKKQKMRIPLDIEAKLRSFL